MSNHTPGKLTVEYMPDGTPYIQSEHGSICSLGPYNDLRNRKLHGWVPVEHDEPNAILFASAPDLLAALRGLVEEFDHYDTEMTKIGRGHEDYGRQRFQARAAIARAEGGV
jgi:hypothetical protein